MNTFVVMLIVALISIDGLKASVILFGFNTPVSISALASIEKADQSCVQLAAAKYQDMPCSDIKAFVGYSTRSVTDLPRLMSFSPTEEVVGPTGTVISNEFMHLFFPRTKIVSSLYTAGVINANGVYYWTGTDRDGSRISNCLDFTCNSPTCESQFGVSSSVESTWVDNGFLLCNKQYRFLCICANPPSIS